MSHYMFNMSPLADTHTCNRLQKSLTALSMVFYGNADQISRSASLNSETAFGFSCISASVAAYD